MSNEDMLRQGMARRASIVAPAGGGRSNGGRVAKAAYERTPEGGALDRRDDAQIGAQRGLTHTQVERTAADEEHHEAGLARGGMVRRGGC